MKIAVFSDVHANLPALEAVLKDIDIQQPDMLFCLGDLVNQNVWNNEVVQLIRDRKITTIKGNHDEGIGNGEQVFPFSYTTLEGKKWGIEAIHYTLEHLEKAHQQYLRELPLHLEMTLENPGDENYRIFLAHGSPENVNEYLFEYLPEARFRELLTLAGADMLLVGHTHRPYHKIIEYPTTNYTHYRHIINVGSAGRPKDGDWHPCYALITIDSSKSLLQNAAAVQVAFHKVDYDLEKAVKGIRNSELSVYYGSCLITGG